MQGPEKIHTRNLITKKNSRGSKIPLPPPNFSNGPYLKAHLSVHIEFQIDDVVKIKFLKLWNLLGYFERTTSERPTHQKLALCGKLHCLVDANPVFL